MKKILIITFLYLISSCKNRPCSSLVYQNSLTFDQGERYTGNCADFHTNGEISSIKNYEDGYDHGKWEYFHSNGKLKLEANFSFNKRIGEWNYYFESGQIWKRHFYKEGKKSGIWLTYDKKGNIVKEERINN